MAHEHLTDSFFPSLADVWCSRHRADQKLSRYNTSTALLKQTHSDWPIATHRPLLTAEKMVSSPLPLPLHTPNRYHDDGNSSPLVVAADTFAVCTWQDSYTLSGVLLHGMKQRASDPSTSKPCDLSTQHWLHDADLIHRRSPRLTIAIAHQEQHLRLPLPMHLCLREPLEFGPSLQCLEIDA